MDEIETLYIKDDTHFSSAFASLNLFRETQEFCDVLINSEDGIQIPAHRVVLSACSPYFRAMFTPGFLESAQTMVHLKCVDGYALRDIIDYFYTGSISVNYYNVEGIIKLANVLQLEELIEKCEVYLRRNMSPKNSLGFLSFAEQYSMERLKDHAMRFCCWYFDYIKDEEEFLLLPNHELLKILKQDSLRAPSEEYILEATLKWLSVDFSNRKNFMSDIIPLIRFPTMNMNYLINSDTIKLLKDNFTLAQSCISEAIQYQKQNISIRNMKIPNQCVPRTASEDIYVIGGWSNGQKLSTVQCFSVDTLKWTSVKNMTIAHVSKEDYFRVIVCNEELYTICSDRVMKYDPVDSVWFKFANGPETQCKWSGVCEYKGNFFVIGGNSLKTSKMFDTTSKKWIDLPEMQQARYYPGVAVLNDQIYVIGGLDNRWYPLRNCEKFVPSTNTWHEISRMRTPRWNLGVGVLNNKLYAIGGSHNVEQFANTVEVYDPEINNWERSPATLNYGRRCLGVAVVNNSIYVVGGRVANTIECFNAETNVWKVVGSVQACCNFGCVALRII